MKRDILSRIGRGVFLLDGATGTMLQIPSASTGSDMKKNSSKLCFLPRSTAPNARGTRRAAEISCSTSARPAGCSGRTETSDSRKPLRCFPKSSAVRERARTPSSSRR